MWLNRHVATERLLWATPAGKKKQIRAVQTLLVPLLSIQGDRLLAGVLRSLSAVLRPSCAPVLLVSSFPSHLDDGSADQVVICFSQRAVLTGYTANR